MRQYETETLIYDMGKDKKQKFIAKAKHGIVSWEDAPEEIKKQTDRRNFDGGEYRKKKIEKKDKASKKDMRRQLRDYENNNSQEDGGETC